MFVLRAVTPSGKVFRQICARVSQVNLKGVEL